MSPKKKARVSKTTASSGKQIKSLSNVLSDGFSNDCRDLAGKHDFGETASAAGKKRKAVASVGKNEEGSKSAGSVDHSHWLMKSEPESRFENGIDVKVQSGAASSLTLRIDGSCVTITLHSAVWHRRSEGSA